MKTPTIERLVAEELRHLLKLKELEHDSDIFEYIGMLRKEIVRDSKVLTAEQFDGIAKSIASENKC